MDVWLPVVDGARESLASKQLLLHEDFQALADDARSQAFTVAQANTLEAVEAVRDAVSESIDEGTGLKEFAEKIRGVIGTSTLGIGTLENVLRTNVASAYAAGQEAIYSNPAVSDRFPFVETLPLRDSRLTDLCAVISHSGLDGTGVFWVTDPTFQKFKAPRHWRCRCGTNYLTVAQAARNGVKAAQEWLATGIEPPHQYVDPPEVDLPPGWVSGGGIQLSFCSEYVGSPAIRLSNHADEAAILMAWIPFTTKGGKPAAYWDQNPKRKLYGKAYAAWAARQGQGGAAPEQGGGKKAAGEAAGKQPKDPNAKPAGPAGGAPDNPANPKLKQPVAKVSADLAKIAEQAKQDLADAGHPVNRLAGSMKEFSVGKGMPKVKTIAGAGLSDKDHAAMGRFHSRLSRVLAINGNAQLSKAQALAAEYHFGKSKPKGPPATETSVMKVKRPAASFKMPSGKRVGKFGALGSLEVPDELKANADFIKSNGLANAVQAYTNSRFCVEANEALRSGKPMSEDTAAKTKELSAAIQKAPTLKSPILTYRGVSLDPQAYQQMLDHLSSNNELTMKGFVSSTINPSAAVNFSLKVGGGTQAAGPERKQLMFEIAAKKGLYVSSVSKFEGEREYLMDHGSRFKIVGVKTVKYGRRGEPIVTVQMEQQHE